ncbi:myosin heavy chain, clone 203-like [Macrobrachium rosenbergii]|uniref:myosin heavy chain, clone 203-like n=1 Tax=Macrobrachium rosenbergii TaxID=79674 RepID=UPI0034D3E487
MNAQVLNFVMMMILMAQISFGRSVDCCFVSGVLSAWNDVSIFVKNWFPGIFSWNVANFVARNWIPGLLGGLLGTLYLKHRDLEVICVTVADEITQTAEELQMLQRKNDVLTWKVEAVTKKNKVLQEQHKTKDDAVAQLKEDFLQMKKDYLNERDRRTTLETAVLNLSRVAGHLESRCADVRQELQACAREKEEALAQVQRQKEYLMDTAAEVTCIYETNDLRKRQNALQRTLINKLEEKFENLLGNYSEAQKKNEALATECRHLRTVNDKDKEVVLRQQEEIDHLTGVVRERDWQLWNERAYVQELERRLQSLENERTHLHRLLEDDNAKNADGISRLRGEHLRIESELLNEKERRNALEAELTDLLQQKLDNLENYLAKEKLTSPEAPATTYGQPGDHTEMQLPHSKKLRQVEKELRRGTEELEKRIGNLGRNGGQKTNKKKEATVPEKRRKMEGATAEKLDVTPPKGGPVDTDMDKTVAQTLRRVQKMKRRLERGSSLLQQSRNCGHEKRERRRRRKSRLQQTGARM